jgi:TPR repeat protein
MVPAPPRVETPAPPTECDRLAASPGDLDRPQSIPGVVFEEIDTQQAIPACRAAVELHPGDPRLAYTLGRAFDAAGQYDEAVAYYHKAADAGYASATSNLGTMYQNGLGVAKDEQEAARLFHSAAAAGNTYAMNNLGLMYQEGRGVAKDQAEAVRLYRKAADAGNAEAMSNLDVINENGRGVATGESEAPPLDRKAADSGMAEATKPFGEMYEAARDTTTDAATPASQAAMRPTPDVTDCDHLAASPDDLDRPSSIPGIAFEKIDPRQAIPACRKAVDARPDDPRSAYMLGRALDAAKQNDEAIRYYRKAVDAGCAAAMNNLATKYRGGYGVAKDAAEAVRLYRKAADAGNARAMLNLGRMYRDGNGVEKNETEAARLTRKAADSGAAKPPSTPRMSTARTGRLGSLGGS